MGAARIVSGPEADAFYEHLQEVLRRKEMVECMCPHCEQPVPIESPWETLMIRRVVCPHCDKTSYLMQEDSINEDYEPEYYFWLNKNDV